MILSNEHVESCRRQFPALSRRLENSPVIFFDGPAGTQVPHRVIDAVSHYLAHSNANHGGCFLTSRESDAMMDQAHGALAGFVGASDPATIIFGPNMTTLTLSLSRALGRTWSAGDEVIVTRLDHDANVTPWILAARDAGATVKFVELEQDDCTLDLNHFHDILSEKTKLLAVGYASNATGTINPVIEMCAAAHQVGALVFVDAVHFAPHGLVDVQLLDCDFLACSAYKFFGPHVGILWGRRQLLEQLEAYKLRPAPDQLPGKWMTGTASFETIAGTMAAVDYLADLGRDVAGSDLLERRDALGCAYDAIGQYERGLARRLLDGLADMQRIKVWGIVDSQRANQRLPTVSLTHQSLTAERLAERLGQRGIFVWHGNYYALQLTETLGLEPDGMVRVGMVHYNTSAEVDSLLNELDQLEQE